MLDTLIFIFLMLSLAGFVLHFFQTKYQKYFGIAGWVLLSAGFLCMLPEQIAEGGIIYPVLIIVFIPIVYITVKRLLADDEHIRRLTYGAGVGALAYTPFALIQPLGDWLISTVVSCVQFVFTATGFPYQMYAWDTFESVWLIPGYTVGYRDQIILGCTGITAIAIMLGVVFLTPTSWKKKVALFCLITIPIYIVNIFRNVFVIRAYFEQWFPFMEEQFYNPTIPGYASFVWSHNIICEGAAFLLVIIIAILLFKLAPGLVSSIKSILLIYRDDARALLRGKKQ